MKFKKFYERGWWREARYWYTRGLGSRYTGLDWTGLDWGTLGGSGPRWYTAGGPGSPCTLTALVLKALVHR
jgi:hypothetical protein